MQLPKNSSDLTKSIRISEINLPSQISYIFYSKEGILPAYTLYRVLPLLNTSAHLTELYEGLFSILPYLELKGNIFLFSSESSEIKEFIDASWALDQDAIIFSCQEVKGLKGKVIAYKFDEPLCEINTSLSLLFSLIKGSQNPRLIRVRDEISDFSDLEQWIKKRIEDLYISRSSEIVLSPIFKPSEIFIRSITGLNVSSIEEEPKSEELLIIYSTAEVMPIRRYEMKVLRSGKKFREFLLDVDPILAPIYLIILTSYAKLAGGF